MKNRVLKVGNFEISNEKEIAILAGPCQLESLEHGLFMAKSLKEICDKLKVNFVFKTSFDKANRTSVKAKRGVGIDTVVNIFKTIKQELGCPIVTDFHNPDQLSHKIIDVVDIVQIPAFLCRQTDLLKAAAETGKVINVKKGQFLSPKETHSIVEKLDTFGNPNVILCDRGTSFGYNTLINDMTCYPIMAETGCPVCCDATHSVQRPGAGNGCTIGNRDMAEVIARAAVAVGVACVFMEVHQDPDNAPSDGPNMIKLSDFERIVSILLKIDKVTKGYLYNK